MSNGKVSVWQLPGNPDGYPRHEGALAGVYGPAAYDAAVKMRDFWNYGPRLLIPEQPYSSRSPRIEAPFLNERQRALGQVPFTRRALLYNVGDLDTRRYGGILVVVKFPDGSRYATLANKNVPQGSAWWTGGLWKEQDGVTIPYSSPAGSRPMTAIAGYRHESLTGLIPSGWFFVQDNSLGAYTADAIEFWQRYMDARQQRDPRAEGVDLLGGEVVAPRLGGAAGDVVGAMDADFWAAAVAAQAAAAAQDSLRGEGEAMEDARAAAARDAEGSAAAQDMMDEMDAGFWAEAAAAQAAAAASGDDEVYVHDDQFPDETASGTGMVLGLAAVAAAIFMATK